MSNYKTIQNDGAPIYEYRAKTGDVVTIEDNQCRDVPAIVADELLKEYPNLRVVGGFYSADTGATIERVKEVIREKVEEKPDFLAEMEKQSTFACSVCGGKYKTDGFMRRHMKLKHNA